MSKLVYSPTLPAETVSSSDGYFRVPTHLEYLENSWNIVNLENSWNFWYNKSIYAYNSKVQCIYFYNILSTASTDTDCIQLCVVAVW